MFLKGPPQDFANIWKWLEQIWEHVYEKYGALWRTYMQNFREDVSHLAF